MSGGAGGRALVQYCFSIPESHYLRSVHLPGFWLVNQNTSVLSCHPLSALTAYIQDCKTRGVNNPPISSLGCLCAEAGEHTAADTQRVSASSVLQVKGSDFTRPSQRWVFLPEKPRSLISDSSQPPLTSKGLLLHEDYSSELGPQQHPMRHPLSPSKQRPAVAPALWAPAAFQQHSSRRPALWVMDQGSGCQLLMTEFSLVSFELLWLMCVRLWYPHCATRKESRDFLVAFQAVSDKKEMYYRKCQIVIIKDLENCD